MIFLRMRPVRGLSCWKHTQKSWSGLGWTVILKLVHHLLLTDWLWYHACDTVLVMGCLALANTVWSLSFLWSFHDMAAWGQTYDSHRVSTLQKSGSFQKIFTRQQSTPVYHTRPWWPTLWILHFICVSLPWHRSTYVGATLGGVLSMLHFLAREMSVKRWNSTKNAKE